MSVSEGCEGPLAEFVALRQELYQRTQNQHQLFALQLTFTGAIFAFAITRPTLIGSLLVVPISSYLLCGRFIAQASGIDRVSSYIQEELDARVPGGLGWEAWSRDRGRTDRIFGWLLPTLLTFPGAAFIALAWTAELVFGANQDIVQRIGLFGIWVLAAIVTGLSAHLVLRAAYRNWLSSWKRNRVSLPLKEDHVDLRANGREGRGRGGVAPQAGPDDSMAESPNDPGPREWFDV